MSPRRINGILKVLLAILVIASIAGLYFANKTLTGIAKTTSKLKADVEISQKQITTYQQTKTKVDSLSFVNELANKVLPADEDQSTIVAEISQFAARSHLTVTKIAFEDTSKTKTSSKEKTGLAIPKGVAAVPITVQFAAGARYNDLLSFLKSVENNQRKMQVTNITLQPDENDRSKFAQIDIAFNLYARQQTTSGAKK